MVFDQQKLSGTYQRLVDSATTIPGASEYFAEVTRLFGAKELWREYVDILSVAPGFDGGVVLDVGCKFGHALPVFHALGAQQCIGVDVDEEYLRVGNLALSAIDFPGRLVKSDDGYLPIDGNSVDFVLVNEVISHVNPVYLDTLYSEIARVLKTGGRILIADGNNRANAGCVADLRKLFASWEMGPAGTNTGRDTVSESFLTRRKRMIADWHPNISSSDLEYLAVNTSGLFGDRFAIEVNRYLRKEPWVPRPYRFGICPTNPGPGGVVMERAFHPVQVELALAEFGIAARQVYPRAKGAESSVLRRLAVWLYNLRLAAWETLAPNSLRGRSWAFYVVGTKMPNAPVEWHI